MKRTVSRVALLLLLAVGCNKNETPKIPTNPDTPGNPTVPADREIAISAVIAASRTPQLDEDGGGIFSANDTFTLYAYDGNGGSAMWNYTVGASNLYWRDVTFASEGKRVSFAACYPQQVLDKGMFDFTVTQNADGDLLLVTGKEVVVGMEQPVELTFRHVMHRLTMRVTIEDESVDAETIELLCTAHASGRFDLSTGKYLLNNTKKTFSASKQDAKFILYPQPTSEVSLEVRAGGLTKHWTLSELDPKQEELEPGKELEVELTIKNGTIQFSGMTIEGWGNQGTIDGEIIL